MWILRRPIDSVTRVLANATRESALVTVASALPRLLRHAASQPDADQGGGRGVLLIPGFGLGDSSLAAGHVWLRERDYRPAGAGLGKNVGCTTRMRERVEQRLEAHAETTGGRVIVLGHSRGGSLGRLVAVRRPDLVRGLVMLGSPVRNPFGVNAHIVRLARLLAQLSRMGIPDLLDVDCLTGTCYRENRRTLSAPLPHSVPALAMYSREDAVVPWQLCHDPHAECAEVCGSHLTMGFAPAVYSALEPKLAAWADDYAPSEEISVFSSTA